MNEWQAEFRRELDRLGSWTERAKKIEASQQQASAALSARNETLLSLRPDFDRLTVDFWQAFGRGLGCENPPATILAQRARMRSFGYRGALTAIASLLIVYASFASSRVIRPSQ
jgi:hypothetical protein